MHIHLLRKLNKPNDHKVEAQARHENTSKQTLQGEKRVSLERGACLSTSSANLFTLSSGSYTS